MTARKRPRQPRAVDTAAHRAETARPVVSLTVARDTLDAIDEIRDETGLSRGQIVDAAIDAYTAARGR